MLICLNLYVTYCISFPAYSFSGKKKKGLSVISCGLERNPDLKGLQEQFNIGATALSVFCIHFSPAKLRSLVYKGICFSQVSLNLLVGKVQLFNFLWNYKENCSWEKIPTQPNLFLHLNTCKLTFMNCNKHWVSLSSLLVWGFENTMLPEPETKKLEKSKFNLNLCLHLFSKCLISHFATG